MVSPEFYAHGKLLLTGEYFVLKGAKSLALPLKKGQKMKVEPVADDFGKLYWQSLYLGNSWFKAVFHIEDLSIIACTDFEKARFIETALKATKSLSKEFLTDNTSLKIIAELEFSPDWGLGSSSSLLSNIATWAGIDPFLLHSCTSYGSAYDIACAQASGPVVYTLKPDGRLIIPVRFNPPFMDAIYFVYLGEKADSAESIKKNSKAVETRAEYVKRISEITEDTIKTTSLPYFMQLLTEHEEILSQLLLVEPVKRRLFPDFQGSVKSLGAWGGDFIMAVSGNGKNWVQEYFRSKGMNVFFTFNELVL